MDNQKNSPNHPHIVVVGHGSRNENANRGGWQVVEELRLRRPRHEVSMGFVELAQPSLDHALDQAARTSDHLVVAPLFLFAAGHVKNDIPLAIFRLQQKYPTLSIQSAQVLACLPQLISALNQQIGRTLANERDQAKSSPLAEEDLAIVVVGRGSSDPDANSEFYKLVRLLGEHRPKSSVWPCFMGIATPQVAETLQTVARIRPRVIVVVPHLLFSGQLIEKLEQIVAEFRRQYAWIPAYCAPALESTGAITSALDHRIQQSLDGEERSPCQTCQYRTPIGSVANQVGGLKALLWTIRHNLTHQQAMPHVHAHRPIHKHVLVCGNIECANRGSIQLIAELRRLIKQEGQFGRLRVTQTSCMGRCGEGPTVAVYPDGIWYRNVQSSDAQAMVFEHLLQDRLVSHLVDQILQ